MYRTLGVTPDADYLEVMEACDRLKVKYADDRKQVRDRGEGTTAAVVTKRENLHVIARSCRSCGAMFSWATLCSLSK